MSHADYPAIHDAHVRHLAGLSPADSPWAPRTAVLDVGDELPTLDLGTAPGDDGGKPPSGPVEGAAAASSKKPRKKKKPAQEGAETSSGDAPETARGAGGAQATTPETGSEAA